MSEKKTKESKKLLEETVVRSTMVSDIKKGLVKASDVERARREIDASKAREKKKQ